MVFNSFVFAAFLPIVLLVYYRLSHRAQNAWLLAAGLLFYGWWDWRFLGLLGITTVLDFVSSNQIDRAIDPKVRRRWLLASLTGNLVILGFFKYFNFFVDSAVGVLGALGVEAHAPALRILLPIGVSFYTFQEMAYTIDVYRRDLKPSRSLLNFALFVCYFPQLVAGPIQRARDLLPQIEQPRRVTGEQVRAGVQLIFIGLFKKVVVADALAPMADAHFNQPSAFSGASLLLGLYLFAIQIYCDFSGYTDIARGVSKLLGIELAINFRQPYFATSITEFWRRWHISLSSWLRDYLYIPLGGNRGTTVQTYRNLLLTMLLGGLWHGAQLDLHRLGRPARPLSGRSQDDDVAAHRAGRLEPCRPGAEGAGDLPPGLPYLDLFPRRQVCGRVDLPGRDRLVGAGRVLLRGFRSGTHRRARGVPADHRHFSGGHTRTMATLEGVGRLPWACLRRGDAGVAGFRRCGR